MFAEATLPSMMVIKKSLWSRLSSRLCSQGRCGSTFALVAALEEAKQVEHVLRSPNSKHCVHQADLEESRRKERRLIRLHQCFSDQGGRQQGSPKGATDVESRGSSHTNPAHSGH